MILSALTCPNIVSPFSGYVGKHPIGQSSCWWCSGTRVVLCLVAPASKLYKSWRIEAIYSILWARQAFTYWYVLWSCNLSTQHVCSLQNVTVKMHILWHLEKLLLLESLLETWIGQNVRLSSWRIYFAKMSYWVSCHSKFLFNLARHSCRETTGSSVKKVSFPTFTKFSCVNEQACIEMAWGSRTSPPSRM